MKQRNDQRKPSHAGTMELSFQCTCKILQRDVHPHARLAGGTAVGSSSPRSDTHSCPRAHTWTHTWGEAHTLGHIVTLPPALPPGLDDLLNSSNYQALTDRQIRPEQGCWGLHGRSDPETQTQRDKHGFPRERRKWKKADISPGNSAINYSQNIYMQSSSDQTKIILLFQGDWWVRLHPLLIHTHTHAHILTFFAAQSCSFTSLDNNNILLMSKRHFG